MKRSPPKRRQSPRQRIRWILSFRLNKWFWVAWFLIAVVFLAWSWRGENGFQRAWKLRTQRKALERENRMLRSSNDRLKEELHLLRRDPSFLEWIARSRLGMIGEDERLYIFQE
jgi:cell division protein FtsB